MVMEWRTRRISRRYVFVLGLLLGLLAFVAAASANVDQSSFNAGDGNLVVNGSEKDWANIGSGVQAVDCVDDASPAGDERHGCGLDKPTGATDDSFGQGTSENDDPPSVVAGSIPNNKSDLTRFYVYSDSANDPAKDSSDPASQTGARNEDYVYLGWERVQEPTGTTNMDFEFNQNKCVYVGSPPAPSSDSNCSSNNVTPVRTQGDALIKYDLSQGGTTPNLGYHIWETQAGNPNANTPTKRAAVCEAGNKFPCWGKLKSLTGDFEGAINSDAADDPIEPNATRSLSPRTFGEAGINLTDSGLLPAPGSGSCVTFGSGYLKSRSSDSFTAEIKDFIAPIAVDISNCGSIELKKALVPSSDSGRFDLYIKKGTNGGGGSVDSELNVGDGGTTGSNSVFSGTYNVSELAHSGTTLSNYSSSVACVDSGNNSVSVDSSGNLSVVADQHVVCTITNTRKTGKIELQKDFVGTAESVLLKIGSSQGGSEVDSATVSADGTTDENTVPTGNYFVSEALTTPANYSSSLDCFNDVNHNNTIDSGTDTAHTVNTSTGQVAVGDSEDVICRFTNTRKSGTIELQKHFVGAAESVLLKIGSSQGGSEVDSDTVSADGGSTGENTVDTGNYYVSETLTTPGNYDASLACFNDVNHNNTIDAGTDTAHAVNTSTGQVAVGANEDVICRFTNSQKPTLTVVKACVPANDSGLFNLQIDSVTRGGGDTACGGDTGAIVLGTGSHSVGEVAGTNTDLSHYTSVISGDCAASGSVSLAYGDNKTCTITNTKRAFKVIVLVCEGSQLYSSEVTLDSVEKDSLKSSASPSAATLCGLGGAAYDVGIGSHSASVDIGATAKP